MGLGWQALGVFLGLEALGCIVLVLPLPLDTKRSLLQFLSSSPYVAKAQTYLWVIFFILLALFAEGVDSLREAHLAGNRLEAHHGHTHEHVGHEDMHALESHLYASQRNALLTGISLFLLLLLSRYVRHLRRFVSVVTALFKLEQNAEILKKQAKNQESAFVQHTEENEKLRKELDEHKTSLGEAQAKLNSTKMVTKQVENQQKEYMRVLDENERLKKEVEDLTTQLTAKPNREKKDD